MNGEINNIPVIFSRLRMFRKRLLLIALAALAAAALIEFLAGGLVRRTFVFYTMDSRMASVEERYLKRSSSREVNITRYVEEALLGPVSPHSLPLFPPETRLLSLLYRDGVVYVNLSEDAAMPAEGPLAQDMPASGALLQSTLLQSSPLQGGEVFINMKTLYSGVRRNFSFVKDLRFFIAGKAAYAGKFR
ncbi:MAG: GerMN domain-containing protein [Treponema sp.]|jgi:hypothetical protein|nr:GerMN domain-containing protein [Treponema sp.]